MYNHLSNLKNRKKFSLTPVKIFLDDIEEILNLLYEYFDEKDLVIESDKYIYENFEEITRSSEDTIKTLKITAKNEIFSICFDSSIEINFKDVNLYGLAFKIFYVLRKNKIKLQAFLYHFYIYYNLIPIIIFFVYLFYIKHLTSISSKEITAPITFTVILYLAISIYFIFFFLKKEKLVYSKIILHWKKEDLGKIVFKRDNRTLLIWLKIIIPPIVSVGLGFLLNLFFK